MSPQAVDLIESGWSGTIMKHRFEDRDRFAAKAPSIRSGAHFQLAVKVLRKILDQQSSHGIARISNRYRLETRHGARATGDVMIISEFCREGTPALKIETPFQGC